MTLEERFAITREKLVGQFGEPEMDTVEDLAQVIGYEPVVEFLEALLKLRLAIGAYYGGTRH